MSGYGDRDRTHEELCTIFNDLHPQRSSTRSTVIQTLQHSNVTGKIRKLLKSRRLQTSTNKVVRSNNEVSPSSTNLALNYGTSRRSVMKILKIVKNNSNKLVQELVDADFD